jgi:hypothetical protein
MDLAVDDGDWDLFGIFGKKGRVFQDRALYPLDAQLLGYSLNDCSGVLAEMTPRFSDQFNAGHGKKSLGQP